MNWSARTVAAFSSLTSSVSSASNFRQPLGTARTDVLIFKILGDLDDMYQSGFSFSDFTNLADDTVKAAAEGDAIMLPTATPTSPGFEFSTQGLDHFITDNTDVTLVTYQNAGDGPSYPESYTLASYTICTFGVYYITISAASVLRPEYQLLD